MKDSELIETEADILFSLIEEKIENKVTELTIEIEQAIDKLIPKVETYAKSKVVKINSILKKLVEELDKLKIDYNCCDLEESIFELNNVVFEEIKEDIGGYTALPSEVLMYGPVSMSLRISLKELNKTDKTLYNSINNMLKLYDKYHKINIKKVRSMCKYHIYTKHKAKTHKSVTDKDTQAILKLLKL